MIRKLTFLILLMVLQQGFGQSVSVSGLDPIQFTSIDATIAGDPPVMVYESVMGDVVVDVEGGTYKKDWYVTVSKSTALWDSDLRVEVKRDPSHAKIVNGINYVTVPDSPSSSYFFESNNKRNARNIDLQHKVTMTDISVGAGSFSTTITYTLVDL